MGIDDRISDLEEKLEETPVNKATEKERARLKSRIAELKKEKQQRAKGTGETSGYAVEKRGDATVALVGFPSVGKSTLLNALTNAESETGAYEFTTLDVEPGMLKHEGAYIQLLDVPGLIGGAAEGRGGGKQVLSVVRNADLVLVLLDPEELRFGEVVDELEQNGIRPNQKPPRVKVERKDRGGIRVSTPKESGVDEEVIKELAREKGYTNANVIVREDLDIDRFIDALMDNRRYIPMVSAVNKIDTVNEDKREQLEESYDLAISAETGENLEELKDLVFERLSLTRVYMKKDGEVDREEPLVLSGEATVESALESLPGDMKQRFKAARVSGPSSDFPDQEVGLGHELEDGDVLEFNLKHV